MSDAEKSTAIAMVDPLVWHYQRERRLNMKGHVAWDHVIKSSKDDLSFTIKVNLDFVSNAKYLDVLVPSTIPVGEIPGILNFVLENARKYADKDPISLIVPDIRQRASMRFEKFPDQIMTSDESVFTGRIFFYTIYSLIPEDKIRLFDEFKKKGLFINMRDGSWISEMQKYIDRPTIFLSHDSKDKDDLVRELANLVNGKDINVWYDELSLKPGDRLRKSLDKGLEEADYFMPIVTENFLSNTRYAEYELDAILQKYITEKTPIIVPICVNISPGRLKEISRILADIICIQHTLTDEINVLANKIRLAVDPKTPIVGAPLPPETPQAKEGLFSVEVSLWQESPPEVK